VENAIERKFTEGEIIVQQEDIWPYLFVVTQGEINATKESPEGRILIVTTLSQGDIFFGLAFFVDGAYMPMVLQANTSATIHLWSREFLSPIIKQNGELSWRLCMIMIKRMQLASDVVDDLAFQPVTGRLSNLLLDVFGDAEDDFQPRILTLDDMAARIGTTREVVCRHLHRFVRSGAIEMSRTELKIADRQLLENQAGR
jgi:CRP/FNR family transcriptional regulator